MLTNKQQGYLLLVSTLLALLGVFILLDKLGAINLS
jgi:hypothetical protein